MLKYVKLLALLMTLVLSTLLVSGCTLTEGVSKNEVKKKMTEYLESTYNKKFEVEEPQLIGNEGFGYNSYQAYAYPVDETKMRFRVQWEKGNPGNFDDGYIHAKWRNPAKDEFDGLLKEIYKDDIASSYGFNFNFKYYEIDFEDVKDLSYEQVVERYHDKIYIDMKYYVFVDGSIDKREEAEKVYSIIKRHILDKGIGTLCVTVSYMSSEFKDEFNREFNNVTLGRNGYDVDSLYKRKMLINGLGLTETDLESNHVEDIINEFEY